MAIIDLSSQPGSTITVKIGNGEMIAGTITALLPTTELGDPQVLLTTPLGNVFIAQQFSTGWCAHFGPAKLSQAEAIHAEAERQPTHLKMPSKEKEDFVQFRREYFDR